MSQYQIGDCIVKVDVGLCRVSDIVHLNGFGTENKLYYLLLPFSDEKTKIYVPLDRDNTNIRKAVNSDEALKIIKGIPQIKQIHIENEKQREQRYKEAIMSCKPEMWISMIKTMYLRKQSRNMQGKKNTAMDERYFKLAEELLYSELAFALGREKTEIRNLIAETVKKEEKIS